MCAKPIPVAARKCTHCGSFQGWRKYFGIAGGTLTMLVALVAVSTAAAPVFVDLLTPKDSKLSFQFQREEVGAIYAFVSNSGTRPGAVTGASFALTGRPFQTRCGLLPDSRGPAIVEPAKTMLIRFFTQNDPGPALHAESDWRQGPLKARCAYRFEGKEFSGKITQEEHPMTGLACAGAMLRAVAAKCRDPWGEPSNDK